MDKKVDMKEMLAEAAASTNAIYHDFLLSYKINEQIVYGFIEGKDDPSFYRGFIDSNLPDDGWRVKLIESGNKAKVLETFNVMDWSRFPKKRVCFFVDRDLSEFLGDETRSSENIYVTDNYSIENDVVNFNTMERILQEVFGVTGLSHTELESIRILFEYDLYAFCEAMAPVMAQILLWRRAGENVILDNIKVKDFFFFKYGKIELLPSFSSQKRRVEHITSQVCASRATDEEIADAEVEFRSKKGIEKYIRGKYLLWFFVQCAKEIHKATPTICKKYKNPPNVHIGFGPKNAMVVIAPRARCPISLKAFLERNYKAYIRERDISSVIQC